VKVQCGGCEERLVCLGKKDVPTPTLGDSSYPCELPGLGTKVRDEIPLLPQSTDLSGQPGGERNKEVLRYSITLGEEGG
jgi:hypothetical protein